eukprot:Anaeramoba_flamelloidesa87600_49.p2 GENE.a87600_49~~a87600_49.p2  ORF type:complete len:252 (-),score=21.40 a87600_49:1963-2718(-)
MRTRIIAKLDVKPPNVVKPVHFECLRKIDKPHILAKRYYEQGADELVYVDIVSSLYRREIQDTYIEETANELFIPFTVGGAVRSIDDFSKLIHIGADKVAINTYAVQEDPSIINKAAETFGSQAVVVNIESKKWDNWWECYTDCGRVQSRRNVLEWVKEVEERGAGEIFLQSVDHDGRKRGFDLELAKKVVDSVNIPVVVASGAGKLEDIRDLILFAKPSGVAISSMLHYDISTISEIKEFLKNSGIEVSK